VTLRQAWKASVHGVRVREAWHGVRVREAWQSLSSKE